ncbi:MAG: hypothetical protein M3552_02005 [Planctomycetota bacterium]|nr:hypothetical protein [Planctomycetaceae bacterium]MDQ3329420.1 hypothetical protein [Planctomycetota bacterium]
MLLAASPVALWATPHIEDLRIASVSNAEFLIDIYKDKGFQNGFRVWELVDTEPHELNRVIVVDPMTGYTQYEYKAYRSDGIQANTNYMIMAYRWTGSAWAHLETYAVTTGS